MYKQEDRIPKVVIIAGPPLVGKTQYIREHYALAPGFYHFDFVAEYKIITGGLDDFPESESVIDVYDSVTNKLFDAVLFGKKDLVFEYCTGYAEMDDNLAALIGLIKEADTEVHLVQLTAEMDAMRQRQQAVRLDPDYVSSYFTNEPSFDILSSFFEDLPANQKSVLNCD
jgi:hypothetical protein